MSIGAFEFETLESSHEAGAFYESIARAASKGETYRPLTLLAMKAARAALVEGGGSGGELEFELEAELEWETSPQAFMHSFNAYEAGPSTALMEHLGHAAAEAESNGEAFAFLAPLIPLALKALPLAAKAIPAAMKMLPKAASMITKIAPKVIKGVNAVAKTLRTNPVTKPLVRAIPQVVQKTTADLAGQLARGQKITAQSAAKTLAKQTARVLGDPKQVVNTVRRANAVDKRFHQAVAAPQRTQPSHCHCR
jgi:hypothetical protein